MNKDNVIYIHIGLLLIVTLCSCKAQKHVSPVPATPPPPVEIMGGSIKFSFDPKWKVNTDPSSGEIISIQAVTENQQVAYAPFSTIEFDKKTCKTTCQPDPSKCTVPIIGPWKMTILAQKAVVSEPGSHGVTVCSNVSANGSKCIWDTASQADHTVTIFPLNKGKINKLDPPNSNGKTKQYQGVDDSQPVSLGTPPPCKPKSQNCEHLGKITLEMVQQLPSGQSTTLKNEYSKLEEKCVVTIK